MSSLSPVGGHYPGDLPSAIDGRSRVWSSWSDLSIVELGFGEARQQGWLCGDFQFLIWLNDLCKNSGAIPMVTAGVGICPLPRNMLTWGRLDNVGRKGTSRSWEPRVLLSAFSNWWDLTVENSLTSLGFIFFIWTG